MKMDIDVSKIEKGRKIIVTPRPNGSYEISNREEDYAEPQSSSYNIQNRIVIIAMFLILLRIALGDKNPLVVQEVSGILHNSSI